MRFYAEYMFSHFGKNDEVKTLDIFPLLGT